MNAMSPPAFVSYPKSGRTWLHFALRLAGAEIDVSHAGAGTTSRYFGQPFAGVDPDLFGRSHVVFMHRNPLDTAVSFYFQVHRKDFRRGSWSAAKRWLPYRLTDRLPPVPMDEFVLHPGFGVPKICAYNRAWLDALAAHPAAHVVTYEDARRDTRGAFTELFAFLGLVDADVDAIVEQTSFDRMKALESKGTRADLMLGEGRSGDPESRKVRKGKIRGYGEYLEPEAIERCREIAARSGFTI